MNSELTQLFVAPDPLVSGDGHGTISLGLSLGGGPACWGDVLPPLPDEPQAALIDALRLRDLITPALAGQKPGGFRDFCVRLRAAIATNAAGLISGEIAAAGQLALQQAYLHATAMGGATTVAAILRAEYELPAGDTATEVNFYMEISDHRATAERIDRMIALRPAGIGYRLTSDQTVEAIGPNAEYLQRFVRELGQRAAQLAPGENYRPAMYLGLNGALGQLAGDPMRHVGKILGNVVGFQSAAGERRVILEDPFHLPEWVDQTANLHRLKDFIRRAPDSLKRSQPTLLVASGTLLDEEALQMLSNTAAVHALAYDPLSSGGLDQVAAGLGRARAAGLDTFLLLRADATPRWAKTVAALAEAARPMAVVVSADRGDDVIPLLVARHLAEMAVEIA